MNTLTNEQIIDMVPSAGAFRPHYEVSDKYSFVSTIEAVDILKMTGWLPVAARECKVMKADRQGFQKHTIRFSQLQFNGGREERVDLLLSNSHDRGSAFHLSASIWRKVCSNGLMVASNLFNFTHIHMGFDKSKFIESAYKIAEGAGQIAQRVSDFKGILLSTGERQAFAESALILAYDQPNIQPADLLMERRYDDKGHDLWTTYNVVQENVMKGGLSYEKEDSNGRMRRNRTRSVKSLDRDIKLNKALWVLTERMAELKDRG